MCEKILTIMMLTYNHEKYIEQSIESVLQQDVNFDYEIIIGDDSSTDNTVEILQMIQEKYPNKIKLILHEENVGAGRNVYDIIQSAKGKYITRLEGDDFWEKTDQLQWGIDFLEHNPDFIGVSRGSKSIDIDGNLIYMPNLEKYEGTSGNLKDFLKVKYIGSTIERNFYKDSVDDFTIIYKAQRMIAENILGLLLLERGKVYITSKVWEVKRSVRDKKASNYNSLRTQYQIFEDYMESWDNIERLYKKYDFSMKRIRPAENMIFNCLANKNYKYIGYVIKRLNIKSNIILFFHIWIPTSKKVYAKVKRTR